MPLSPSPGARMAFIASALCWARASSPFLLAAVAHACCDHRWQTQTLVGTGMKSTWAGTHWEGRAWRGRERVVENHLLPAVQRSGFPWRRILWCQCRYFLLSALPFLSPVWLPRPPLGLGGSAGRTGSAGRAQGRAVCGRLRWLVFLPLLPLLPRSEPSLLPSPPLSLFLPVPSPSLASAGSLPLAALLSWCGDLLSILLLAGRVSFHAWQTALLLVKDADSGSLIPVRQSWESVWFNKAGKQASRSYLDLKHILGVISCLNLRCNYLCWVASAHHCHFSECFYLSW